MEFDLAPLPSTTDAFFVYKKYDTMFWCMKLCETFSEPAERLRGLSKIQIYKSFRSIETVNFYSKSAKNVLGVIIL